MLGFVRPLLPVFSTIYAFSVLSISAHADQDPIKQPPSMARPPDISSIQVRKTESGLVDFFTARTPYEFWLTVLTAATGCFIIWLISNHVSRLRGVKPEDITRPVIVITIVMGSLILIIAGFSNEQIAAAFGLFGTIVGYMLGKMNAPTLSSDESPSPSQPAPKQDAPAPESPSPQTATLVKP